MKTVIFYIKYVFIVYIYLYFICYYFLWRRRSESRFNLDEEIMPDQRNES